MLTGLYGMHNPVVNLKTKNFYDLNLVDNVPQRANVLVNS
jgi:hypothetical protein